MVAYCFWSPGSRSNQVDFGGGTHPTLCGVHNERWRGASRSTPLGGPAAIASPSDKSSQGPKGIGRGADPSASRPQPKGGGAPLASTPSKTVGATRRVAHGLWSPNVSQGEAATSRHRQPQRQESQGPKGIGRGVVHSGENIRSLVVFPSLASAIRLPPTPGGSYPKLACVGALFHIRIIGFYQLAINIICFNVRFYLPVWWNNQWIIMLKGDKSCEEMPVLRG